MVYCFDIGGSFVKYGVVDRQGRAAAIGQVPTPLTAFDDLVDALRQAIATLPQSSEAAVSLSIAGFIDPESGQAQCANVPALNGRPIARDIGEALGFPVTVANDADCFAVAEAQCGAGRGHRNVFAIILGTGVGGGLVIDGRPVVGPGGVAGEWGHGAVVDPTAGGLVDPGRLRFPCTCGRIGCVNAVGGARGLERVHTALGGAPMDSRKLLADWAGGDAAVERTIAVYLELLCRPLGLIVNTAGISIVPVGGGLASSPELLARIDRRLRELVLADFDQPLVVKGEHADDGGLIGAGLLAGQALGVAA
jgi:N-acetylglucosamine kinase